MLIPGLGGSSFTHWQARWRERHEMCEFVNSVNWNLPDLESWLSGLDSTIRAFSTPPLLAAHSLGCALVAHWVARAHDDLTDTSPLPVRGALLVAPADVDSDVRTPPESRVFAPMPLKTFGFPTTVVASENDPYIDVARAQLFATAWGADYTNIGHHGHINADSHLGDWPQGWELLKALNCEEAQLSRA